MKFLTIEVDEHLYNGNTDTADQPGLSFKHGKSLNLIQAGRKHKCFQVRRPWLTMYVGKWQKRGLRCNVYPTHIKTCHIFAWINNGWWYTWLTSMGMKLTAFWDVASCSLVEVCRRSIGAYCHHQKGNICILTLPSPHVY